MEDGGRRMEDGGRRMDDGGRRMEDEGWMLSQERGKRGARGEGTTEDERWSGEALPGLKPFALFGRPIGTSAAGQYFRLTRPSSVDQYRSNNGPSD